MFKIPYICCRTLKSLYNCGIPVTTFQVRKIYQKSTVSEATMENKYVLFDCDTGSDDAIAMMMLLKATKDKKIKTVGITCVAGNTPLPNVVMNNLRLLKLYDLLDEVPVYKGCHEALVEHRCPKENDKNAASVHGNDGMGDVPDLEPKRSDELIKHVIAEHAASAISTLSKKYAQELTLIATGPLTNLALAVKLDPEIPKRLKNLYIMGGTREGTGNITPAAEYNFYVDPEAALVTIRAFATACPVYLVDYGYTTKHPLPPDWVENNWLGKSSTKKSEFAAKVLGPLLQYNETILNRGLVICDAYAMAMVLDPSIASNPMDYKISVEVSGIYSRGHVILNKTGNEHPNFYGPITLYENFDMTKYQEMLNAAVA